MRLKIDKYLVLRVHPVISQISNSDGFPVIGDLFTSTIDNMGNFVSNDKLEILRIGVR
mgnify:CR=1 FL=1